MNVISNRNFLLIIIQVIYLYSCKVNTVETIEISKVNSHKDYFDNLWLAKCILSYDFPSMFHESTGISPKDERLIGNIKYDYSVNEKTEEVTITLTIKNQALELKDTLVSFFKNYVTLKKKKHVEKYDELHIGEERALEYKSWIDYNEKDSITANLSPLLNEEVKEQFEFAIKGRSELLSPDAIPTVVYSQIHSQIEDYVGEFYVYACSYENGIKEIYTLHNVDGKMLLLGYHYFLPNV